MRARLIIAVAATSALLSLQAGGGASAQVDCITVPTIDTRCEAWVAGYDSPGTESDQARGLAVGGNRAFVTGLSDSGYPAYDIATVAYDVATGQRLWATHYNGPLNHVDIGWGAVAAPDGSRVYVTGESVGPTGNGADFVTIAYDGATGAELWVARKSLRTTDQARGIALSPDAATVFIVGKGLVEGINEGLVTVAYDAASGEELWSATRVGASFLWPAGIAVSPSGDRVFSAGYTSLGGHLQDYIVSAYRARVDDPETQQLGEELWRASYDGSSGSVGDLLQSVVVAPDGSRAYVTGQSGTEYATVAFDAATGQRAWVSRYRSPMGSGNGGAVDLVATGSAVFVAGWATGRVGNDYVTVAYDPATGTERWTARFEPPQGVTDRAWSIAASPDGRLVYTTGTSGVLGSGIATDVATAAYDATLGTPLWTARYNTSPALDGGLPWTMEVAANGRIVVASTFDIYDQRAPTSQYDYVTIAYDP